MMTEEVVPMCGSDTRGWFWKPGRWTRDKIRGAALKGDGLMWELDLEPSDIFSAKMGRGWVVTIIRSDESEDYGCEPGQVSAFIPEAEGKPEGTYDGGIIVDGPHEATWLEWGVA